MRRTLALIGCIVVLLSLAMPVFAASRVDKAVATANVTQGGSCRVTVQLTFILEEAVPELFYTLPEAAESIAVNGSRVFFTSTKGGFRRINLMRVCGTPGIHTLTVSYTMPRAVSMETEDIYGEPIPAAKQRLLLTVPLLWGFAYPVQNFEFSIQLPQAPTVDPVFISGYHREQIQGDMEVTVTGNQVSGRLTKPLKDKETLRMEMDAAEMFPRIAARNLAFSTDEIFICIFAGLALIYWLLTLRSWNRKAEPTSQPPEGITAGHLGWVLMGRGADLTMMVLTWAQLGYILIHVDNHGRVMLHKRMDMGNERSDFECKAFQKLFGTRRMVDGTGYRYAQLHRKIAANRKSLPGLFRRRSGNMRLFTLLMVLVGVMGGVSLGISAVGGAALSSLTITLLGILGGIFAWVILQWVRGVVLHTREYLIAALICAGLWLATGILVGDWITTLAVLALEFLAGLAVAYGGRRSELGHYLSTQVRGLRKYLKKPDTARLSRIYHGDSEYFFSMMPYALALGLEKTFAESFGPTRISGCPYLTTGMDGHMSAKEWSKVMRRTVFALDARQRLLPLERLLNRK